MFTLQVIKKMNQIINAFECSYPPGRYDQVTVNNDGPNKSLMISYGRCQVTEQSNLRELLTSYVNEPNAIYAKELKLYIKQIGIQSLATDVKFKSLLRKAGNDIVMTLCQDQLFEERYFEPAMRFFAGHKFTLNLSMLVIFDSYIHSGSIRPDIRAMFPERTPADGGDEKQWIRQYLLSRKEWLSTRSNPLVKASVYRVKDLMAMDADGNWDLSKSVIAHKCTIE